MRTTILPLVLLTSGLFAQSVVVPNANENTLGTGQLNSIIRNAGNPRSYNYGVNAGELAGIPLGSVITGVSLRFSQLSTNPLSWPPADITWTDYDIYVGPCIATASWGPDPALNWASPPQQVRSGPMTLDADLFSNLAVPNTPNPWAEFYFDFQEPFLYLGGDLGFLFSHPGSNDPATARYPETVASNAAGHGVGRYQTVYPAGVSTNASTFYVMRIHYGYGIGCPSSLGTAPVLVQNGNTTGGLGGDILLQVGNVQPNAIVVWALGFQQLLAPIGNGCDLLVSPDVTTFMISNNLGRATLTFNVPPAVVGDFYSQAAVLDFNVAGGLAVTNGVSPSAF